MFAPSIEEVIEELKYFRAHKEEAVRLKTDALLTALEKLQEKIAEMDQAVEADRETLLNEIDTLVNAVGNDLERGLLNPTTEFNYQREYYGQIIFIEALHHVLLAIGRYWPRNHRNEENQPIDPITLDIIAESDLFVSLDRHQWSLSAIESAPHAANRYVNPLTRQPFADKDIEIIQTIKKLDPLIGLLRDNGLDNPTNIDGIKRYLFTYKYSDQATSGFTNGLQRLSHAKILNQENLDCLIKQSNMVWRAPETIAESLVLLHEANILSDDNRSSYTKKMMAFGSGTDRWIKQLRGIHYLNQASFTALINSTEAPKQTNPSLDFEANRLLRSYCQKGILNQLIVNNVLTNPSIATALGQLDKFNISYNPSELCVYLNKMDHRTLSQVIPIIQRAQNTLQSMNETGLMHNFESFDLLIQSLLKNKSFEKDIHAGINQLKEAELLTKKNFTTLIQEPQNIAANIDKLIEKPHQQAL